MWPNKTMEEVWRWKDEIARETENMTVPELLAYYRGAEQRLADKTGGKTLNLRRLTPPQRPHPEKQK
jgi:hypothetical protein